MASTKRGYVPHAGGWCEPCELLHKDRVHAVTVKGTDFTPVCAFHARESWRRRVSDARFDSIEHDRRDAEGRLP